MNNRTRHRSDEEIIARAEELTARPLAEQEADYRRLDAEWDRDADHGELVNTLIRTKNTVAVVEDDYRQFLEEKYS